MPKILSFDIEIAEVFNCEKGEDIEKFGPFTIACAATSILGGLDRVWPPACLSEEEGLNADWSEPPALDQGEAHALLEYLADKQRAGTAICAWNGLGFDLKWLGENACDVPLAAEVALKSYDPMFQFFCLKGYPVSLAAVSEAMGVRQKKAMDGAGAPKAWAEGRYREVMDYCLGDCQITNKVVQAIATEHKIRWVTRKGRVNSVEIPHLLPVSECLKIAEPDVHWMDAPIPRSKFYGWTRADNKGALLVGP